MEHITVTRFSSEGFDPQNQRRFIEENGFEYEVTNPKFESGVWVFVQWHEDKYLLNHLDLDEIPDITFWQAEVPLDTEVFKHDNPHKIESISTVKQEIGSGAFFIPDYSLKNLFNITELMNPFEEEVEENTK